MAAVPILTVSCLPLQTKVVADATASFSAPSLTVPAGGTMNFEFTITAPASLPGAPHMLTFLGAAGIGAMCFSNDSDVLSGRSGAL